MQSLSSSCGFATLTQNKNRRWFFFLRTATTARLLQK